MGLFSLWKEINPFQSLTSLLTLESDGTCGLPEEQVLDNGKIRIGLDFDLGGSIGYVAESNHPGDNVINTFDKGREVQMSFYAGPLFYNPPTPEFPDGACDKLFMGQEWKWNPIGAGDIAGGTATILGFSKRSSTEMNIVTRPLQWACNNVPCECTFETTLETIDNEPAVKVTATLLNARTDDYDETLLFDQELPAVYTNGFLYRLITYNGSTPFQDGEPVVEYDAGWDSSASFPWVPGRFPATENWAAFVNEDDWGLGVINPQESTFLGGFSSPDRKGCGGPHDAQTGYIAPVSKHALPRNVAFTYEFYLVLGSIDTIRSFAKRIMLG